jgi:hypothetical protein
MLVRSILAALLVCAAVLAVPSAAPAAADDCPCVTKFVRGFRTYPTARRSFERILRDSGATSVQREKVEADVKDHQDGGGICRRTSVSRKLCAAVIACLVYGGQSYAHQRLDGVSNRKATEHAAVDCAIAAAVAGGFVK